MMGMAGWAAQNLGHANVTHPCHLLPAMGVGSLDLQRRPLAFDELGCPEPRINLVGLAFVLLQCWM
eukprot:COSAG02_NODE_1997_length_10152_cov_3.110315_10_plen_66_part_00